ncbi:MAG: CCA tRNA nucleotidyltransferase [Anaerolineales bacterium]|nr:CCA tRNA nucleotidyltransferase [Anaerolineales bacterium]MCW5855245.1 CCA tRNA nucleotidyltransferase [Anaerolineales bacterium]
MASPRLPREPRLDAAGRLRPSLTSWLRKPLSPAARRLLDWIAAQAQDRPLYLVGGFVRDLFLARPSLDLDVVIEGDAIQFGRKLVRQLGGDLQTHPAFRTAVWLLPQRPALLAGIKGKLPTHIDLISARRERYPQPAALPQVELADLAADQARRDFSINTLALRLNGEQAGHLHDPFGGLADLRRGLVRTLHAQSFVDDPTRMLRALRFAGRLGFRLAPATRQELARHLPGLAQVSGERIFHELELALQERPRVPILQAMQRAGLLGVIHPQLSFPKQAAAALQPRPKPPAYWGLSAESATRVDLALWLMWLPLQAVEAIAERLRFEGELRQLTLVAARLHSERRRLARLSPSALVSHLERQPLAAVYALWLTAGSPLTAQLEGYARRWRHVQPHADGHALRRRGLPPGPAYAHILARLRAAWLDGEVRSARQEAALLEELLREAGR